MAATQQELAKLVIRLVAQTGQMKDDLNQAKSNISTFASSAKKIFAGIGVAIVAKQMKGLVTSTIDMMDATVKTSQKIGVAIQLMQEYGYSAKISGVNVNQFNTGIKILSKNIYDAARGTGEAKEVFKDLGIDVNDADGKMRNVNDILMDLADNFKNTADEGEKTAQAQKLIGKSGTDLIPWLNLGAEGIKKLGEEARKTGSIFTLEAGQSAERFNDAISAIKTTMQGLVITIVSDVLPTLELLAVGLKDFVLENRKLLSLPWEVLKAIGENLKIISLSLQTLVAYRLAFIVRSWTIAMGSFAGMMALVTANAHALTAVLGIIAGYKIGELLKLAHYKIFYAKEVSKWDKEAAEATKEAAEAQNELNKQFAELGIIGPNAWKKFEQAKEKGLIIRDEITGKWIRIKETIINLVEDSGKVLEKLNTKIAEIRRQFVALNDPVRAATMALGDFIDKAMADVPMTEDLRKKINELWEEYNKYTDAVENAKIEQAYMAESIANSNRKIAESLQDIENKYQAGLISFKDYYEARKKMTEDAVNKEIAVLVLQKEKTRDLAEQIQIETKIRDKKAELQRVNTDLSKEETNAMGELTGKIEEMIKGSESGIESRYKKEQMAVEDHYEKMLEKVKLLNDEKLQIGEEYYNKQEILDKLNVQKKNELDKLAADEERRIFLQKLAFHKNIANQVGNLAGQIYTMSGEKAEAFFYLQQAAAAATATMNAYEAYTKALAQVGPFGGPVAANLMFSLGMAQVGLILAQTFHRPKKMAVGGLITSGAGGIDDVPIMGMKNEYVIPASAVKHYGVGVMDAIRSMVIPRNWIGGNVVAARGSGTNYSINVPVSVENPKLVHQLRTGIEKTVVNIMRNYAR